MALGGGLWPKRDNHWSLYGWMLLLLMLSMRLQLSLQVCMPACPATVPPGNWSSSLRVEGNAMAREVTLGWAEDASRNTTFYVVQFREVNVQTFNTSSPITGSSYTIDNLTPNTNYEGQVCRANGSVSDPDNCGRCLFCFSTTDAQEPPSRPRNVQITATGPQIITVTWDEPEIKNGATSLTYTVACMRVTTGTVDVNSTGVQNTEITFLTLLPNTMYSCSVVAFNDFGGSVPAIDQITTPARNTIPGLLLLVFSGTISYAQLTESSVRLTNQLENLIQLANTSNDPIRGLDYHFYRGEIYATTANRNLSRMGVNLMSSGEELRLEVPSGFTNLLTRPSGVSLGAVAVDWVNNHVFFVERETESSTSRILRLEIDGSGDPYCVGQWTSNPVGHIEVDPVHGYFYWSQNSLGIYRVESNAVQDQTTSCPSGIPQGTLIINDPDIVTFTIESSLYHWGSSSCSGIEEGLSSTTLNADRRTVTVTAGVNRRSGQTAAIASFSELVFVALIGLNDSRNVAVYNTTVNRMCPAESITMPLTVPSVPSEVQIMRAFRSVKQPLPVPPSSPTDVRVQTTSTNATISWSAPQFVTDFFSNSSFQSWTYYINYTELGSSTSVQSVNTSSLSLTLTDLLPDSLYEFTISVAGPGGEVMNPSTFILQTKMEGGDDDLLLLATEVGVVQTSVSGGSAQVIAPRASDGSNGITYDAYTGQYYWVIAGDQSSVYCHSPPSNTTVIHQFRDSPFSLKLDWVSRQLLWVENGETLSSPLRIVGASLEPMGDPVVLTEVERIISTAVDSLNGLMFWVSGREIHMKTLNGLVERVCFTASRDPLALTVDVSRQLLYWVSYSNEMVIVSQVEYSRSECGTSPDSHTVSLSSNPSSPTALAYASGTLFISTRGSSTLFTIPANLSAISQQQTLAVGTILLSSLSPTPQGIRDIAVASTELQPLPDGLTSPTQSALIPQPVGSAPRLGSMSTNSRIVVEWDPAPPLPFSSPIVYRLEYSLVHMDGSRTPTQVATSEVPSVSLDISSTYAEVTASVTSYSLWQTSNVTRGAVFRSPPALPMQVQNVQAFVYYPMFSGGNVSALVTWDALTAVEGGGFVQNYTVQVFQNGQLLPPLYQNPDNRTTYTVQQRVVASGGATNSVRYPLVENMEYVVRVFASNPTGDGPPSANVTFNTNMASPPQQVVAVGASESQLVQPGSMPSPLSSVREPLTVDTTGRQLYWYDGNTIQQQSLDGGDPQPINVGGRNVRALAYNWLGQTLYFAGQVERGGVGRVGVWVYHTVSDRVEEVFVGDSLLMEEGLRLVVDSFRGYLYWTIANDSSNSLYQLNLQDPSMSSRLTVPSSPMSKRQATLTLSSLSLTPALALSPRTGRLWVCDANSGDILSCSPVNRSCTVEVEAAALGSNDIGLPASSLALDELRVYWTNDASGIFAVAFSDNTTVIEISPTTTASSVVSLSPGQQPLPSQDCLSPILDTIPDRPLAELVSRTNTSITVSWPAPTLEPSCTNIFFPPLMYMVRVALDMNDVVDGFPQPSVFTQFRAEGLSPYVEYIFNIGATNEFTELFFPETSVFGGPSRFRTLEGVPDPPRNVSALEYGTQNINVKWVPPDTQFDNIGNTLRGPTENLLYYVRVGQQEIATIETEVNLTRVDGLLPGTLYTIEVLISNGVLNSSATEVPSTTWPLPPTPVVTGFTNTSFSVTVPLNQTHFPALFEINIEYCQNTSCDCTSFMRTTASQTLPAPPRNLTFQIEGLERFTDYCLRAVANYTVLPGFPPEREMLAGSGVVRTTGVGVPDAPRVMLDGDTLTWDAPNDRGSPITGYRITAMSDGVPSAETFSDDRVMTINLRTAPNFLNSSGVTYSIQVFAENDIGEGPGSVPMDYMYTATPTPSPPTTLPTETIIGIVAAAVAVLVLLIICVFAFVWCMTVHHRHKEVDIRSINYQYGYSHDHELSNLRGLRRHQQANNPHYTWSRDDYICTDEQLEQLNKFPRQNLKLETFIDRGEFGEVYQGTAIDILGADTGPTPVAVKTLRKGSTPEEQAKFLSEAALMGNFNHENIVKVLGVCVDNDPVYIIMELMLAGDLLKFLRDAKREHGPSLLTLTEQVHVALDVAKGCRYLEQQHFIHRDIAARNCLVSSKGADRVVKIGDFGLAKDLYSSDYYQVEGQRKLPVRWMAPEALLQGKFTIEADIWSFGVLLWEIMTLGNQPYPGRTNQEVLQFVTGGGRLDRPDKCPGRLYHLMQNCWKRYSSERPHFQQIVTVLTNFQEHLNNKRESAYYESDSDDGADFGRQGSAKMPSRTPSIRSGILNLARSSSMKLRNSLRRHGSLHRRDEHSVHNHHQFSVSSSENLIASVSLKGPAETISHASGTIGTPIQDGAFRERGPF